MQAALESNQRSVQCPWLGRRRTTRKPNRPAQPSSAQFLAAQSGEAVWRPRYHLALLLGRRRVGGCSSACTCSATSQPRESWPTWRRLPIP